MNIYLNKFKYKNAATGAVYCSVCLPISLSLGLGFCIDIFVNVISKPSVFSSVHSSICVSHLTGCRPVHPSSISPCIHPFIQSDIHGQILTASLSSF